MHADEAARAESGGTRFPAEAGSVGRVFDRELLQLHDFLAMQIRDRHFGGRHKVEVVVFAPVLLILELGKLGGANQGLAFHQQRRAYFRVAMLLRVQIEQELNQRPFELCAFAHEHGESAAANLRGALEVQEAELFTEFDMGFGLESEFGLRAPRPDFGVRAGIRADGRIGMRQIRNLQQEFALLLLARGGLLIQLAPFLRRCRAPAPRLSAVSSPLAFRAPISLLMRLRSACNC